MLISQQNWVLFCFETRGRMGMSNSCNILYACFGNFSYHSVIVASFISEFSFGDLTKGFSDIFAFMNPMAYQKGFRLDL